ncbi:MAG TPA: GH25 family lysozyme [Candidatus Binatia bacterium]|jgi:lysozyme
MSSIEVKYSQLKAQGFIPAQLAPGVELPVVSVPTGDGKGTFFAYAFVVSGISTPITIYDHPSNGTFEVHGAILAQYLARGGPLGDLGYPISDEYVDVANGTVIGRISDFQRGSIFWNALSGLTTVMLVGPVSEDFEIVEGIDVSDHQGAINWSSVAGNGVVFAYIKATEGDNVTQATFTTNWSAASGKVSRGAYHYFHPRANVDATRAQVDHFINTVNATGDLGDLPPMVDVEELAPNVTADQAVASLQFFLSLVEQGFGRRPVIYTFPSFWQNSMKNSSTFSLHYNLWIANYGAKRADGGADRPVRGPIIPGGWPRHTIWQYAVLPGLPGVTTLVDRNSVFLPARNDLGTFLSQIP